MTLPAISGTPLQLWAMSQGSPLELAQLVAQQSQATSDRLARLLLDLDSNRVFSTSQLVALLKLNEVPIDFNGVVLSDVGAGSATGDVVTFATLLTAMANAMPGPPEVILSGVGGALAATAKTSILVVAAGGATNYTLADGPSVTGMGGIAIRKWISARSVGAGGTGVVTPATKIGFTTFTASAAHDAGLVEWDGTAWNGIAATGTGVFA